MSNHFSYSRWDGSQEINPLQPDELLDLLADDLLDEGSLRDALNRLLSRGARRPDGDRLQGLHDLLERLRNQRQQQLSQYDLGAFMDDIGEKLGSIVDQERTGIEQRLRDAGESGADEQMRQLLEQLAGRKRQFLDDLPEDPSGRLEKLMDYEFMDSDARDAFNELVNDLRQKMMGSYFQGLQQGIQNLTPEDLAPVREMVRELNKLLAKRMTGESTDDDFHAFMQRFGSFFPPDIETLDDLIRHLQRQAAQMASLMKSLSDEQRLQLEQMMDELLRDDRLRWDLAQMAGMLEEITGQRMGQSFPFDGDTPLGMDEALRMLGRMQDYGELERQLQQAMRQMDPNLVDEQLLEQTLGAEERAILDELRRLTDMLEEAGLARRKGRDIELTPKGIRLLGQKALRHIFAELRKDRSGQHDARNFGLYSDQLVETKPWEFGDPFLVDIGKTVSNAVFRQGPGTPVNIEVKDLEVYKTENLVTAATIIVLDMSYSMVGSGAFREAKRVALALNTLISSRYPRDYLELVVFSYFATELKPERLLESDWVRYGGGTNIQEGLRRARQLLRKHKSMNRQIILITDAHPTTYTSPTGELMGGWGYGGRGYQAIEETLKEVRRCTQNGITINTFMMARDPSLIGFAKLMSQINKGRAFFATPGRLGHYILVDYLRKKSKVF
ncbi:MAG: VWA domain-containing protein [Dehalococcoidia bacterium]|nr:VWA domain-containing protein [Dehalococcoidia bacterium]